MHSLLQPDRIGKAGEQLSGSASCFSKQDENKISKEVGGEHSYFFLARLLILDLSKKSVEFQAQEVGREPCRELHGDSTWIYK